VVDKLAVFEIAENRPLARGLHRKLMMRAAPTIRFGSVTSGANRFSNERRRARIRGPAGPCVVYLGCRRNAERGKHHDQQERRRICSKNHVSADLNRSMTANVRTGLSRFGVATQLMVEIRLKSR